MIKRDGNNNSLWQKTAVPYKVLNRVKKDILYDVIIIGGGITGMNTALLLQRSGFSCLVLEARNLCFGTTGGTTAHINTLLDTPYTTIASNFGKDNAKLVANAAKEAVGLIRENIRSYSIDCTFETANAYLFSKNNQQTKELKDIVEATKQAGVAIQYTKKIPVPVEFEEAAIIPDQAKFHPVQYVYGLATAFEKSGGVIVQQCRALAFEKKEWVTVMTSKGRFMGNRIIYATHTPLGVNLVHLRCQPFRSYAIAVYLEDESYPEGLSYDMDDPYHYYRTQEINGQKFLIAGGYDHQTGKKEDTKQSFEELETYVRKKFKVSEMVAKWSSQYFEPADGLPYIGRLPGSSDAFFVAGGFGGNGMTYSHVAALVLKAILLKEDSPYVSLFDPGRIKPVAGFKNFVTQNFETAKNFIGRLFPGEKLHELKELKPGKGKVVVYEQEKIAIYKDRKGNISAVNPVCTHLGCELAFNESELSWDCSCHGTRYSIEGEVLTAPADRPLDKIVVPK